ncbi:MAG: PEGA domain-containing protein [Archangiaceae bacterium]|nr:PEGA domain-containing protein [Archangiaceae bacterium]
MVSVPALAQDDDELPALPAAKPKPKPNRPKPKPAAKKQAAPISDDDLPALPAQKGDLVVKLATPMKGARLTIDDREIGLLPQPMQSLTAGEHTLTVRRLGYALFSKKVVVAANKTSEVAVSLEAVSAVLTVSSDVAGAQVFVNGRLAGTAPLIELEVPPGSLEVAVKKDGYHDGSQVLTARPGKDYPIEVKLGAPITSTVVATNSDAPLNTELTPSTTAAGEPITGAEATYDPNPFYKTWWFWTATVVVVTAIVVGSVLLANGPLSSTSQLRRSDFKCYATMACDGWVNMPTAIVPLGMH